MPDRNLEPDSARIAHAEQVHRDAAQRLLAIPGVSMVALGSKETGGQPTGELVIRVHVANKRPLEEIPPDEVIPAEIDGVGTDVIESDGIVLVAAPPGGIVRDDSTDDKTERPLKGGTRIQPALSSAKGERWEGTLGCLLWLKSNHDVGYALTNQHVIDGAGLVAATKGSTEVGQPTSISSSSCCNDIIGVYRAGERTGADDQAVVQLRAGTTWQAQILGIGLVSGTRSLSTADALARLPVRKRGARTRLTGGVVTDVNGVSGTAHNAILIQANDNPDRKPGELLFFDEHGDSGSAVVDDQNRVCGLVFARRRTRAEITARGGTPPALPPDGIERPLGVAWPIADVLARFAAGTPSLTLEVATATSIDEVHTVPGAARVAVPAELAPVVAAEPAAFLGAVAADGLRAPVGRPWFAADRPLSETLAEVRAALEESAAGRYLTQLWQRHRVEVTRLLRDDRRVAVTWHRGGGAALFQLLSRMVSRPELALPETVRGVPVQDCVDAFAVVLIDRASASLGADVRQAREVLPDLPGRTLAELVAALDAMPIGVGGHA
ncbi:hypothetical protein LWC33_29545 [Pseudonocardia sp. RS11V-5]|uniref:hypothetical protein n=1 Tax=Pseudonocardia terrae TaxID=2905831 RepID=UPI001E2FB2B9|nr:hypothetical protein [Pseudonocardia terrae]MCE3555576.1 hypothetical protein [Pseudonocardia terrae]